MNLAKFILRKILIVKLIRISLLYANLESYFTATEVEEKQAENNQNEIQLKRKIHKKNVRGKRVQEKVNRKKCATCISAGGFFTVQIVGKKLWKIIKKAVGILRSLPAEAIEGSGTWKVDNKFEFINNQISKIDSTMRK